MRTFDSSSRRIQVDIGQSRHGQGLKEVQALSRQPPVVFDAEQHMFGYASDRDEHAPRLRRRLRAGDILVEFAAGDGRDGHGKPRGNGCSHMATLELGLRESRYGSDDQLSEVACFTEACD